jgi:uncharacterized SAM-binding protein YcdF (DUF218 family)
MLFPIKLVLFIAAPLLVVVGIIFLITQALSVDDLKNCTNGPQASGACQKADAIVAISGGDTDARTQEAIQLFKAGWADRLILSGAAIDKTSISNAAAMRLQALRANIPDAAITLDQYANDTAGNAADVSAVAAYQSIHRLILVTSPYHQRRASIEFKRALGSNVVIVSHPTPYDRDWSPAYWWLHPYSWYLAISELAKLTYLQVTGK